MQINNQQIFSQSTSHKSWRCCRVLRFGRGRRGQIAALQLEKVTDSSKDRLIIKLILKTLFVIVQESLL